MELLNAGPTMHGTPNHHSLNSYWTKKGLEPIQTKEKEARGETMSIKTLRYVVSASSS